MLKGKREKKKKKEKQPNKPKKEKRSIRKQLKSQPPRPATKLGQQSKAQIDHFWLQRFLPGFSRAISLEQSN